MEQQLRFLVLRCAVIITLNMSVLGNILDMTCVSFNPTYDPNQPASFAAVLSGSDITSTLTFQRSIHLTTGSDVTSWCSYDDDVSSCQLPSGSNIESYLTSSAKVTLPVDSNGNNFGAYSCRAERHNWTTTATTLFIRSDAQFTPYKLTVTASIDEEVRLVMNAVGAGTGSLVWMLNGQTDLSASVSSDELYISRASESMAGVHHYYYNDMPERGGIIKLIVRGCLDNLWGPSCQYTCPTCYNGGICDDRKGRCVCPPGFMGDHCETACLPGFVGKKCLISCVDIDSPNDCQRALFCLPDPYGCSCAAGWSGLDCSTGCAAGTYGAGCTQTCHCASSNQCDPVTGSCDGQGGCDTGWYGPQCQVHIVDMVAFNLYAGVEDTSNNFIGVFMMEDLTHSSIEFYIGREVDTGPGETGHGVTEGGQGWQDSGLPEGTVQTARTISTSRSLRATFDRLIGGAARTGAFRTAVSYKGRMEKVVMINEYRGDYNSEVWAEKQSYTIGVGETMTLTVQMRSGLNQGNLVWRRNGDDVITAWRGLTSVTLSDVRKSDEGIYECYIDGNRETGEHAIVKLFVRDCPSKKYGMDCSNDCRDCNAGGICHYVTGECVCRPGFQGSNCETGCGNNNFGKSCSLICSSRGNCRNRLLSVPDPVGMSCQAGFGGNRCETVCYGGTFGANCELNCNCASGVTCNSATGCQGACAAGYWGDLCQASGACNEGYFGTLCNYPCHCKTSSTCDQISGQCPNDDSCADGWAGSDCQQALPRLVDSPWILDVTSDSVLIAWNAWKNGYDYGTGPVHSYLITYSWTDDVGNTGISDEPVAISGDSTANITGLYGYRDYEFLLSVRREVDGIPTGGISSSPIRVKTQCDAPLYAPSAMTVNITGAVSIEVTWQLPNQPGSEWLRCNSSSFSYNLTYWPSEYPADFRVMRFEGDYSITHLATDLSPCTEYIFSVVIINSIDLPGPEGKINGTTDVIAPDPVDDLTATSESYDNVKILWAEPATKCFPLAYQVTRTLLLRDQCDDTESDISKVSTTNETFYTYDDLYAHSTYNFTVLPYYVERDDYMAIQASWTMFHSNESVPTEKPGNLAVGTSTKQALTYMWIIPPCETRNGDIFYRCTFVKLRDDDPPTFPEDIFTASTTLTYRSLSDYTSYNFTVCAYTSAGAGPCDSIQARTLPSASVGLIAGLGVGIPLLLIVLVVGIVFRRRQRSAFSPQSDIMLVSKSSRVKSFSLSDAPDLSVEGSPYQEVVTPPKEADAIIHGPILERNLANYVKQNLESPDGFEKEFKDLYSEAHSNSTAFLPRNKMKNRYNNIVTFEEHRVKLHSKSTEPGADYINATFIDGYRKDEAYIATQAPNNASVNDFWQMIYEQNVATVVMLTNLVEDDKVRCFQYWPESNDRQQYGNFVVTCDLEQTQASFIHRRLELRPRDSEEARRVSQYHFTIWPEKGEPESSQPLIDFRNVVRNEHPADASPLVVHCSGGAGRTGTFLTIDSMMSMIEHEKKVDIFNFVNNMRKRRSFMVQVQSQYEFIYETLLQWSVCPVVTCHVPDIAMVRSKWRAIDPTTGKTEMAKQFELLDYITPGGANLTTHSALRPDNVKKNRFPDRVPADRSRPRLKMEGDYAGANDYINASVFNSEGKKNAYISTQWPLSSTVTDILRLVWDYGCQAVVYLDEMDKTCVQFWPTQGKKKCGSFTVELFEEYQDVDFVTKRVLNITSTSEKEARRLTQYHFHGWPKNQSVPKSKSNFCWLILHIQEENDEERPLLIVCIDGFGKSGTFLAAMATINKVKRDKTVDVFSAVKRLRKTRPGVVDSLERYELCFDVVEAYSDYVKTYVKAM